MPLHLGKIRDIANVIAGTRLINKLVFHQLSRDVRYRGEGFQDRNRIVPSTTKIVDLRYPWGGDKFTDKACNIQTVDVVAHLFSFVAENLVRATFHIAFHQE